MFSHCQNQASKLPVACLQERFHLIITTVKLYRQLRRLPFLRATCTMHKILNIVPLMRCNLQTVIGLTLLCMVFTVHMDRKTALIDLYVFVCIGQPSPLYPVHNKA